MIDPELGQPIKLLHIAKQAALDAGDPAGDLAFVDKIQIQQVILNLM